jgi:hypothetical protein
LLGGGRRKRPQQRADQQSNGRDRKQVPHETIPPWLHLLVDD